ncbi:MAG TPA: hypothetical protein VL357_10955 [Rariglobus sp.]|jgi:hypothetical protein|nr:hypothetical protein [Rariglobus sp.]
MKKRPIFWLSLVVLIGILSLLFHPAGTDPAFRRKARAYQVFKSVGWSVMNYAKENGHYPENLVSVNFDHSFGKKEEAEALFSKIVYCRPETLNPQKDFILLVEPCENAVLIFYADGTSLQKNGG